MRRRSGAGQRSAAGSPLMLLPLLVPLAAASLIAGHSSSLKEFARPLRSPPPLLSASRRTGLPPRLASAAATGALVLVDVENVRGKSGFELSHDELLERATHWAAHRRLRGAVSLVVDHGSLPSAFWLERQGLAVIFAGQRLKADDVIARDVSFATRQLRTDVLVVTADRELTQRCRAAARDSVNKLGIISPSSFIEDLARAQKENGGDGSAGGFPWAAAEEVASEETLPAAAAAGADAVESEIMEAEIALGGAVRDAEARLRRKRVSPRKRAKLRRQLASLKDKYSAQAGGASGLGGPSALQRAVAAPGAGLGEGMGRREQDRLLARWQYSLRLSGRRELTARLTSLSRSAVSPPPPHPPRSLPRRVTACCSRSDCDGGSTRRWSQSPRLLPPARMCARRQPEPMLCTRPAWAVRAASLQLMLPTPLRMVGRGRLRRRRGSAPRDDPFLPGVHNRPSPRPQPRPLPLPRRPSASSSCQTRTASRRRSPLTRRCFLGCRPRPPPPRAARKLRRQTLREAKLRRGATRRPRARPEARPVRPTARRLLLQWASLCQRGTCFCISGILLSTARTSRRMLASSPRLTASPRHISPHPHTSRTQAGRGIGSRLSSVSTLGYRCSDSTTNLSCAATTTRSTSRSRAPTPRSSPSPLWQPSAAGPSRSSPSPEAAALSYPPAT